MRQILAAKTESKAFASGLMWFRRDLRAHDNAALHHALKHCRRVHCAFVLDRAILDALPRADRRVEFMLRSLVELDHELRRLAGGDAQAGLIVRHASSVDEVPRLAAQLGVQAVFANHDEAPDSRARDARVLGALAGIGVALHTSKDHVVFERDELLTLAGTPYTVFTPYKRAWLAKVDAFYLKAYPVEKYADALGRRPEGLRRAPPTLAEIGFEKTNLDQLALGSGASGGNALFEDFLTRIDRYHETRDYPAVKGPSYLGVHLRFGTVSIRRLAAVARERATAGSKGAQSWLSELIWREFFFQILWHNPHVVERAFRPAYDAIRWEHGRQADAWFAAWCEGRTGYPVVDAAMAQLNQSGYMHGRLRMIAGSFLVKDLGLDWRRGERYFAEKLNDHELASNNGNWQWVASTGCDAQPWHRIFNPVGQSRRFDPQGRFIRKYLPQLAELSDAAIHAPWTAPPLELEAAGVRLGANWPEPLVRHGQAREKALERYRAIRS